MVSLVNFVAAPTVARCSAAGDAWGFPLARTRGRPMAAQAPAIDSSMVTR
jgi:hypothetical protein